MKPKTYAATTRFVANDQINIVVEYADQDTLADLIAAGVKVEDVDESKP